MRRWAPASAVVCALGCGGGEATPQPPDAAPPPDSAPSREGDSVALEPYPGWPADVAVRRVGSDFKTSPVRLELFDGRVWLLRNEWHDSSPLPGRPVLERYAGNGNLEKRVTFEDGALATDLVVHPSGEVTVLLLAPAESDGRYRLELARLSPDGAPVSRVEFDDVAGTGENLYYDDSGVHELPANGPLRLGQFSHAVGLADGEGLYLLAWTYGVKLYRLGPDGAKLWSALFMPANVGMAFNFIQELLAVDERGRVHVASQIFAEDAHIYSDHFHRPPLQAVASYDVLVERFEPDGAFSAARIVGGPGVDAATGMTARAGSVLLTGSSRLVKHDLPNRTLEWDLFVLRASLDDGQTALFRNIDIARDDFAWALAEAGDGTIYLAGRNDYVQVDTNSEVEDGKGLLVALSPDLSRRAVVSLPGPRDVGLRALRLAADGKLVFAGARNGPLTHTEPAMQFNEGALGTTRLGPP